MKLNANMFIWPFLPWLKARNIDISKQLLQKKFRFMWKMMQCQVPKLHRQLSYLILFSSRFGSKGWPLKLHPMKHADPEFCYKLSSLSSSLTRKHPGQKYWVLSAQRSSRSSLNLSRMSEKQYYRILHRGNEWTILVSITCFFLIFFSWMSCCVVTLWILFLWNSFTQIHVLFYFLFYSLFCLIYLDF